MRPYKVERRTEVPAGSESGKPIGKSLQDWAVPERVSHEPMDGRWCRLERIDPLAHAESLFATSVGDSGVDLWRYLPYGPFASLQDFQAWMSTLCSTDDPLFFAVVDKAIGRAVGLASYLNIRPSEGVVEVGHITYSDLLQNRTAGTEAMFLMMQRVFETGYRRYEWKCDLLNASSKVAAQRLGFTFEGVFRQATVYRQRNRDTAWFSIIDSEWPRLRHGFQSWLSPKNFDDRGNQIERLTEFLTPHHH